MIQLVGTICIVINYVFVIVLKQLHRNESTLGATYLLQYNNHINELYNIN